MKKFLSSTLFALLATASVVYSREAAAGKGTNFAGVAMAVDSASFAAASWNWTKVAGIGRKAVYAGHARLTLFGAPQSISVIKFLGSERSLDLVDCQRESAATTSAVARRMKAKAAVNGSYFNVKELTPVTYFRDEGVTTGRHLSEENFRSNGGLFITGRQVQIRQADSTVAEKMGAVCRDALTSGPVLIEDGKIVCYKDKKDPFYDNRHPRTFIGYDKKGVVYLVVVDGRFEEAVGMTIVETAKLAGMLGCTDALNLDGGGSSTLWTRRTGVLSHPYDNKRFDHEGERIVPNILIVK